MQADPDTFRFAMRGVAATVSILTTRVGGVAYGMTATAVAPVSLSPPALLACVNREASIHDPIRQGRLFWVNVLGEEHDEECRAFAGKLAGPDRFRCGAWREGHGMPYLADAQANLLCELDREVPVATHTVFIARVVDVRASGTNRPLIYLDGRPGRAAIGESRRC